MPRKVTALFQCHCPTLYLTNSRLKQNKIYTFACRHWFATSRGTRQEDPIPPTVFIADLERAMDKVKDGEEGISVHGIRINNLRFADDIDIIAENESTLERTVHSLHKEAMRYGLVMNADTVFLLSAFITSPYLIASLCSE